MEKNDQQSEIEAILKVIAGESAAFWNKDYEAWAQCWVHAPYVRSMGWYPTGGVSYVAGWDALSAHTRAHFAENPLANPNAAWVTFDQYGLDTGQPTFDMPGRSRETRFLEKQDGQWRFVYVGYLLEGTT